MDRREVFLNAGDFFFQRPDTDRASPLIVRTLLGSCVSIVMWDSVRRIGGMCHCVLPVRTQNGEPFDGNHCEGAMRLFLRELQKTGTRPSDYRVHLLGGARMSLGMRNVQKVSVGERNVESCRLLLRTSGFKVKGEHIGLSGPRRVQFDLANGKVTVLHENRLQILAE